MPPPYNERVWRVDSDPSAKLILLELPPSKESKGT